MSTQTTQTSQIMLIRHAEKPTNSPPPYGVSIDGELDDESLTVRGWQRAGALACLLNSSTSLRKPEFIYASQFEKNKGSKRSEQTVTPLARKLNLKINTNFCKGDEQQLVDEVLTQKGVVLISWQHEKIPDIANHILQSKTISPQNWSDSRFDLIWVFDLNALTGKYIFKQVPQNLLSTDSANISN